MEANEDEINRLCKLEINDLLSYIYSIEDILQRRSLTKSIHSYKLKEWTSDTRYEYSMAEHLIQDIHRMFRRGFDEVLRKSKEGVIDSSFRHINYSLHHHHGLEDAMWFPNLRKIHPELISNIDILEKDHKGLVALEDRISKHDYSALVEFIELLNDHLNREEIISVPYLLDGTGGL